MNIIVTGGASGVGAALVARLSGHAVTLLDVQAPAELADGHRFVEVDLSSPASVQTAIETLPDAIDALANVAGIAAAEDASRVVAVNFLGLRALSEAAIGRLTPGGQVISVSSVAGRDWKGRLERLAPLLESGGFEAGLRWCDEHADFVARDPYTLSKRLVTAWTMRQAQAALAAGYRVNCISPGPIETPLYPQFESLMGKAQSDWMKAQAGAASADDIAETLQTLLEGGLRWVNGIDLPVDRGYCAGMDAGWIDFGTSPLMQSRSR